MNFRYGRKESKYNGLASVEDIYFRPSTLSRGYYNNNYNNSSTLRRRSNLIYNQQPADDELSHYDIYPNIYPIYTHLSGESYVFFQNKQFNFLLLES